MFIAILAVGGALAATTTAAIASDDTEDGGLTRSGTSFVLKAVEQYGSSGPSGSAHFVNPFLGDQRRDRSGPVVCAKIEGSRAIFGIKDELPNGTFLYREFYAEDHGTPAVNGPAVDLLTEVRSSHKKPGTLCGAMPKAGKGLVLKYGDIVVKDNAAAADVVRLK